MKAFLAFALLLALASAGGYLSTGKITSGLSSEYGGAILNNPHNITSIIMAIPFAFFACVWSSIFGGDYKNCVYTHMYYALGN